MMDGMRPAHGPDELEAVFRFRYEHFFHRFTGGYPGVDHQARRVFEPHDLLSVHTCAFDEHGRLAAVSTATPADCPDIPKAWRAWFALDRLAPLGLSRTVVSTRLVLRPDVRHTALYGRFHGHIIAGYLHSGFRAALHYCRPDLVCRFERLGHRHYGRAFNLPGGQYRVPMLMAFDDPEHLRRVGAPIWTLLTDELAGADPGPLLTALPELATQANLRILTPEERLAYVRSRLEPAASGSLPAEASRALEHAAAMTFSSDQMLMPGPEDAFLACILSGNVRAGDRVLGSGDFAGPAAGTSCPIQALEPGEMLVFSSEPVHALSRARNDSEPDRTGIWRFLGSEDHVPPGHIARAVLSGHDTLSPRGGFACGTPSSTANVVS